MPYGETFLYTRTTDDSATWNPTLSVEGSYEVYVWCSGSSYGNRNTSADYTVNHAGGSQTITIDQDQGSGNWVSLGIFPIQCRQQRQCYRYTQ